MNTMISRRRFAIRAAVAAAAVLVPEGTHAAPKKRSASKVTPESTPAPRETARMRLWKAIDTTSQAIQISIGPAEARGSGSAIFSTDAQEYQFEDYMAVPAGLVVAEVKLAGQPPKQTPLRLAPNESYTLLVRIRAGRFNVDCLSDSPDASKEGGEFEVFNLLPASGPIQINLGTVLTAQVTTVTGTVRLTGIKSASYPISVGGLTADGREIRWNADVDFSRCRKARLLVFTDPYGRVRPRINAT